MIKSGEGRYVAYYRVSTGQQRESGLGLESQQAQVRDYVAANQGRLVGEYSETMSGRRNDRPQLAMALTTCRIMGAVLIIARLDRLPRNVAMIARLMESGLDFVATDFPYANRFTVHVLSAVAEYESRLQSERMKAVLAAVKQRGIKDTKRNWTRRFPPGCQEASAEPDRHGRRREDATLRRSFGSRLQRASRTVLSPTSSTRPASRRRGRANGPRMRFGGLPVLRPQSSGTRRKSGRPDGLASRNSRFVGALTRLDHYC
jgi:DNA invertase Pin-like site-specific DNA recombinase